uniref:Uncharacterized protein n=1 Tax=Chaetoceros debilis TaxID=122233 RepID=A0A7S3QB74_9STRA
MSATMHKQAPPSFEGHLELESLLPRLRPFQREGFDFATKKTNGRLLICDEMGLGKTVTSLAVMLAFKEEWPLLILCPASLRYTWPAEIEKFIPHMPHSAIYVVRGFDDCDFHSNPIKRARIKVVVATYSLLQNRSAAAKALQEFSFKCVIADESHNLKEKTSQRCKIAMPLISGAKRVLLLSGTPALAKPVELWAQLNCVDQDLFGSYTSFTKKYCNARRGRFGYDVSGLSNADELHEKLKQVMIRRLKADVLKELPPKQRSIVPVKILKNEHVKDCRRIIAEMNDTRASISSLAGEEANNAHFEGRSLLMQAYQASGIGKAQAVAEYVLDWLCGSGTQKVLVFAHHKGVLDTIEATISKHFKGVGHIRIDGSVNSAERAARVKKFQNKAQVRLGLLSITAAGVGLTLTAASSVIFAELHWTPGVLAQAEDRCHRIGQVNAVNIMYCVCKDTDLSVDPALWKMLGRKVSNLGRMIDGEKGASMNAVDTENGAPSEQELSSFFAETCATKGSPDVKAPIAKGSIQSFFKKPSTNKDGTCSSSSGLKASVSMPKFSSRHATRPTSATTNPVPMRASVASKSNPFTSASGLKRKIEKPSWVSPPCKKVPQSTKSPTSDQQLSWTCEFCTFINEYVKSDSGLSRCLVCKSRRCHKSSKVGSVSVDLSQSSIDTTQSLTIDEIDLTQSPTNKAKPTPKLCASSQSEIIEICDDSDDDDDDDDDNLRHSPYATVRSIRPNLMSSQKIIPIVNLDLDQEIHETLPTTRVLSFSVSKNSGRIAVYLSDTGESLLINFDYENLIQESTSEELQNRQLKRKKRMQNDLEPDRVLFDDAQVSKGKFHFTITSLV